MVATGYGVGITRSLSTVISAFAFNCPVSVAVGIFMLGSRGSKYRQYGGGVIREALGGGFGGVKVAVEPLLLIGALVGGGSAISPYSHARIITYA